MQDKLPSANERLHSAVCVHASAIIPLNSPDLNPARSRFGDVIRFGMMADAYLSPALGLIAIADLAAPERRHAGKPLCPRGRIATVKNQPRPAAIVAQGRRGGRHAGRDVTCRPPFTGRVELDERATRIHEDLTLSAVGRPALKSRGGYCIMVPSKISFVVSTFP